ncbi:hypothetical protein H6503_04040 [Candidatus Woesearchaeota archaeon]|nr:hypothetical protein [Candidatus Woesearchaeota archaeon]
MIDYVKIYGHETKAKSYKYCCEQMLIQQYRRMRLLSAVWIPLTAEAKAKYLQNKKNEDRLANMEETHPDLINNI